MEKINFKTEIILWAFLLMPLIYIAFIWNQLPASVPIHFNIQGEPNGWAGKGWEFLLIGCNIFAYFFTLFLKWLDPKKLGSNFFNSNFFKLRNSITIFLSLITMVTLYIALPGHGHAGNWMNIFVLLFFAFMGNFMINIKPNWFIGFRTPWTLNNDLVWKKTHLVGGRIMFYGGLLCLALSFVLTGKLLSGLILVYIFGSFGFTFAYSFWVYKQEQKKVVE